MVLKKTGKRINKTVYVTCTYCAVDIKYSVAHRKTNYKIRKQKVIKCIMLYYMLIELTVQLSHCKIFHFLYRNEKNWNIRRIFNLDTILQKKKCIQIFSVGPRLDTVLCYFNNQCEARAVRSRAFLGWSRSQTFRSSWLQFSN